MVKGQSQRECFKQTIYEKTWVAFLLHLVLLNEPALFFFLTRKTELNQAALQLGHSKQWLVQYRVRNQHRRAQDCLLR